MKKRVFVGIKISPETQGNILSWIGSLEYKLPVRWLELSGLHITLIPPWEEENIRKVTRELSQIKGEIEPFRLSLNRITYGPNIEKPRLIWVWGKANSEMKELRKLLQETLSQKKSNRVFFPHITIARFSLSKNSPFPEIKIDERIHWEEKINRVSLFESHRLPSGAKYKELKKISL